MAAAACKRRGPRIIYEGPEGTVEAGSLLHPRGCMGAGQEHIDATVPRGYGWLFEALARGGHRVPSRLEADCLLIDLHEALGVPLTIRVCPAPWEARRVYIMATRSGRLYIAPVSGRKTRGQGATSSSGRSGRRRPRGTRSR